MPLAIRRLTRLPATLRLTGSKGIFGSGARGQSVRAVATRLLAPPQQFDTGKQYINAETWHALTEAQTGQIEIWWPNFYQPAAGATGGGISDTATGVAATGTAQITYTDATSGQPTVVNLVDKTGGTTALTAPNGGWFKAVGTINAAAGSVIKPRIAANFPSGIMYSLSKADIANGDLFQFGTSAIPLSTTPVNTFGSFRTWYGPCLIAGTGVKPVWVISGDSRNDGLRDMANDATGAIGTLMRLAAKVGVAVVNMSARGETAQTFALGTYSQQRRALAPYATVHFLANGINDFGNNRTAAQVLADNATIESQIGLPAVYQTINPWTNAAGTGAWSGTGDTQRQSYNTSVRAKAAYFDPAGVLSAAGNTAVYANDDAVVSDGLHETAAGNSYAAANAAVVGTSLAIHGVAPRAAGPVMPSFGTNLLANSRDLTQASWTKNAVTVTTGAGPDPECQNNAQTIAETTATANHNVAAGPITVSDGYYEHWMDVAAGSVSLATAKVIDSGFSKLLYTGFNLATGAKGGNFANTPASLSLVDYSITPLTNAGSGTPFYRCKSVFQTAGLTGIYVSAIGSLTDIADNSYAGSTSNTILARPKMWLRQQTALAIYGTPAAATTGTAYSFTPTVINASGTPSFVLTGSLPAGLSFSSTTGAITGTPTMAGATSGLSITVTDGGGNTASLGPFALSVAQGALTTWNAATLAPSATLSESNRRLTSTAANQGARATSSRSSGKQYAEFPIAVIGGANIGVQNASGTTNGWQASNGNGLGVDPTNNTVYSGGVSLGTAGIGTMTTGDVLNVKIDRDAGTIQFGKNGTYGTVFNTIPTGALFLSATLNSGASIRISTQSSQFAYAIPSGYAAWN